MAATPLAAAATAPGDPCCIRASASRSRCPWAVCAHGGDGAGACCAETGHGVSRASSACAPQKRI
eukprot:scaffold103165_cov61-Phaeocystis_antarctica.AAC.2